MERRSKGISTIVKEADSFDQLPIYHSYWDYLPTKIKEHIIYWKIYYETKEWYDLSTPTEKTRREVQGWYDSDKDTSSSEDVDPLAEFYW